ncbi:methyltransferase domain-containing protein [Nocardioides sp. TRM66260-LWL]|uniref:class I SAM-dependent methyltransferase n=1 Tax=Nocardioides sp. TRM66260-LWL TaxID=2874478 RepID=UPI001CC7052D|nr:class I SAM-dependent methyltransferase [Nocardioides sp. TRM66260-LWL]MBZ5736095.1 methyltransferase domain-containing protein [Nocardioides sp. TRM66260-LWL]
MTHHHHDPAAHDADPTWVYSAGYWDERYAGDRVWSGRVNSRLVEQTADLTPGRALDVACGEGGDAVWLAAQGWETWAVDVSPVAVARTGAHAAERGVAVTARVWDGLSGDPLPGAPFDLVTAHFLHLPPQLRAVVYPRLADAVGTGGRLLVVGHHPSDVETGVRRPHGDGLLLTAADVVGLLDAAAWEVEVADEPTREQLVDGAAVVVRDTVVRARRR